MKSCIYVLERARGLGATVGSSCPNYGSIVQVVSIHAVRQLCSRRLDAAALGFPIVVLREILRRFACQIAALSQ